MNIHMRQLTAFVAGAVLAVSGVAFGQGSMRDTTGGIPGDTRNQGGTVDTMFDRNQTGSAMDSTRRGVESQSRSTRDSVQGSTGESVAPDNTGKNKRDRNDNEMTADEQGQSPADIDMTRNIRRAIMEDDSLSSYAKNIKIITKDGSVTLKGPVRSEQEKAAIEAKATGIAGAGKVKDQLEVKPANKSKND